MAISSIGAKQHLLTILEQQPEDSTYDELLRELAFARMVDRGLKEMKSGRVITNDEMRAFCIGNQISDTTRNS